MPMVLVAVNVIADCAPVPDGVPEMTPVDVLRASPVGKLSLVAQRYGELVAVS